MSPARLVFVATLAIACHAATAQIPPTVTVQQLAPQLVVFLGSQTNFQSLVNGLSLGTPVQLFTTLPNGLTQVVSFTPAGQLSPVQIAQTLEAVRQQLIGLGIGNPTSEQIAVALMGGVVPTPLGGSQVAGVLNAQNPPSPAAQIQSNAAAGATSATPTPSTTTPAVTPPVNVQLFPGTAIGSATATVPARVNTSDSPISPGAISRSPSPITPTPPPVVVGGSEPAPGAAAPAPTTPERSGASPAAAGTTAAPAGTGSLAAPAAGGADRR